MLRYISGRRGRCWERKLLLFACACLREVWTSLPGHCQEAVETVQRFADGEASQGEVQRCLLGSESRSKLRLFGCTPPYDTGLILDESWWSALTRGQVAARAAVSHFPGPASADLLRDVLGPFPFRPLRMHGSWFHWDRGIAPAIAQEIRAELAFERLPILADALLDAGCTNEELLQHCRSKGPHVLGCWALDVVLYREGAAKHRVAGVDQPLPATKRTG